MTTAISPRRYTQVSVTCFLHCGNDYLFINRTKKGNSSDFGRINGIGGKLEPGEDFLSAAIRETREETGVEVTSKQCQLKAIVHMTGGYPEDWVMAFWKIEIPSKRLPLGQENDEGELLWFPAHQVLQAGYQVVDDLNYCWDHITRDTPEIQLIGCVVNNEQQVIDWRLQVVPLTLS